MKKIETIWHHLLWQVLEKKQFKHTQQGLAREFGYSLSTVHSAVKKVADIGAVRVAGKFFKVENAKKAFILLGKREEFEEKYCLQYLLSRLGG